jgi:ketosteroid isomerase-like protein
MQILKEAEVRAAVTALMQAFGAGDSEAYFDCFAEDATFLFHTEPSRLESLEEYRLLWRGWQDSGWRVVECESTAQSIQLAGTGAVFSHDVRTMVDADGTRDVLHERESIIFSRFPDGRVLAIHEHLSPASVS